MAPQVAIDITSCQQGSFIVLKMIAFHLYLISGNVGDIPGVVSILSRAPHVCVCCKYS